VIAAPASVIVLRMVTPSSVETCEGLAR